MTSIPTKLRSFGACVILSLGTHAPAGAAGIIIPAEQERGPRETVELETSAAPADAAPAHAGAAIVKDIVAWDRGRAAPRTVPTPEAETLRRSVEFVFGDRPRDERRRIYTRVLNLAATTPAIIRASDKDLGVLINLAAEAIDRAVDVRRLDPEADAREEVRTALAALGWAYRVLGATPGDGETITTQRRHALYGGAAASTAASLAAIIVAPALDLSLGVRIALVGAAVCQVFADICLFVDGMTDQEWANAWSRGFTFIDARAKRKTIAEREQKFWFDLEARLALRAEWRDFVKSRDQQPGAESVARDVRDYLRKLAGANEPEAVCNGLLGPTQFPSPFY